MANLNLSGLDLETAWKEIASYLKTQNIEAILVGGGVASIYSQGKYVSGDLDFVIGWANDHKEIKTALLAVGFTKNGTIYRHPTTSISLDFSSPPVDIGEGNDPEIDTLNYNGQVIKILSPTECIKDRLNKYVGFRDQTALLAALAVAKEAPYSLAKVEEFCKRNGSYMIPALEEFKRLMGIK